jgi:hypothetical protein
MFPTFKEFYLENRKGERKPHHNNLFKGFDGKTKKFNMTYKSRRSKNKFEKALKNLRSGAASFLVVTKPFQNYLIRKYRQHKFPTQEGEKVALGRSGESTNQVFLSMNNTGQYVLTNK